MLQALRHYLLAIQFFTRLPVTGRLAQWVGFSPAMLRASAAHFPGVGWLVGAWATLVWWALALALAPSPYAPLVAAVLSTAATAWLTGGFHEDGLADVADGLGGSAERERALDIMKDSRLGAYGAMALVLVLLAKTSLLALLGTAAGAAILVWLLAGHVLSRFWPLCLIRALPHVGDIGRSKSKPLADRIAARALLAAAAWSLPAVAGLTYFAGPWAVACAMLASGLSALWMARWFAQRLQGFTGDCLGAVQQISEVSFYLGAAMALMLQQRLASAGL